MGFELVESRRRAGVGLPVSPTCAIPGLAHGVCVRQPVCGDGTAFDELRPGSTTCRSRVASRAELERCRNTSSITASKYTPIVDTPYGAVLVFRDPDNIQLELIAEPGK